MPITENPTIDLLDYAPRLLYIDDGVAIFKTLASPEGLVTANAGSVALDATGKFYVKQTNGVATGWVSVTTTANVGARILQSNTNAVGNTGGGSDQLHVATGGVGSFTLQADGEFIDIYSRGTTAANANTKRYVYRIAGIGDILNTGLQSMNNATWEAHCRITRVTSTLVRGTGRFFTGVSGSNRFVQSADIAVSDLGSNSIFPESQGESGAAADNDIVENIFQVTAWRVAA